MSNVLHDSTQQQVVALGRLGWSLRRIEAATGVRRETISGYLKAAGVAVRRRGGRRGQWPPANPATTGVVSTDSADIPAATAVSVVRGRALTASACEPYRELIVEGVRRGRNAMAIWQDLVDGHGFTGRYASVRRFVGRLRGTATPEPAGIITTEPGEEAQVDYGEGPMVRDPVSGKHRRTRLFVMTLGCSRKSVRLLTWLSFTPTDVRLSIYAKLSSGALRALELRTLTSWRNAQPEVMTCVRSPSSDVPSCVSMRSLARPSTDWRMPSLRKHVRAGVSRSAGHGVLAAGHASTT